MNQTLSPNGNGHVKIDRYISEHSTQPSAHLKELIHTTRATRGIDTDMLSGPQVCLLLKMLVRISRAKTILELGTFTGASALAMAEEIPIDGTITTIDVEQKEMAMTAWTQAGVLANIISIEGDAKKILDHLDGGFDLAFIDADKESYPTYWELVVPKIRHGGIIVADDTLREGRIIHPHREDDKAMDRFNRTVAEDSRVDAMILPVGDGVTVAFKK